MAKKTAVPTAEAIRLNAVGISKEAVLAEAARGKGCLGRSRDDEPIFVLVGRDRCAPDIIRAWALQAARAGAGALKVGTAVLESIEFEKWQVANGSKAPD